MHLVNLPAILLRTSLHQAKSSFRDLEMRSWMTFLHMCCHPKSSKSRSRDALDCATPRSIELRQET